MDPRPELYSIAAGPSREQAAAIVAVLSGLRRTPPIRTTASPEPSRWLRAGLAEGVDRSRPCG